MNFGFQMKGSASRPELAIRELSYLLNDVSGKLTVRGKFKMSAARTNGTNP